MRSFARSASLTAYPELCRSLGLDPAQQMRRVGLDIAVLDTPDVWLPGAPMARLLELSARESGCADFGVRLAEFRRLGNLGPLSLVLREEADLRAVLNVLTRFEHIYTGVLDMVLTERAGTVTAEICMEFGEPVPVRQVEDLVAAILVGIIRTLVREDWVASTAFFAHDPPDDLAAFHRVFGPNIRFAAASSRLVFPSRDLDSPVVTSDASVRPYARQYLDTVTAGPSSTRLAARAGQVVETLLPLGRCSLEEVARHLGLRPRLLQQQLSDEGASFSTVLHAARARMAERYLAHDRFTLTEISQMLGFAASSAFSRWFRQQVGVSPSEWRAATRSLDAGISLPAPRRSSAAGTPSRPGSAGAGG